MKRHEWHDVDADLISEDAVTALHYSTESSLNLSVATFAHMHGWRVEREIVIPGWGRLDLLLSDASREYNVPIELKLALNRPAPVRKAFQQADGYGRWLRDNGLLTRRVVLCSLDFDPQIVDEVARLYIDVEAVPVKSLLGWLVNPSWSRPEQVAAQRELALARVRATERELTRRRAALASLPIVLPAEPAMADNQEQDA